MVADVGRVAVETVPCRTLAADAYALAIASGRTVYDAMYLALAVRLDTQMITADESLTSAVAAMPPLAAHIETVQTFKECSKKNWVPHLGRFCQGWVLSKSPPYENRVGWGTHYKRAPLSQ